MGSNGIWNVYVANWAKNPEESLENDQFMSVLQECLEKLPHKHRRAFQLKFIKQLDTAEVCKLLNISTSNYWVMLHRGRMALRECVDDNWYKKL